MKDDAFKTIANKEYLNLRDIDVKGMEDSTVSHMEGLRDEAPQFEEKCMKDDAFKTIANKENWNLIDEGLQGVESSTIYHMGCLKDEAP